MKPERFRRTKAVMASSVIAVVIAALTFGVASAVLRPASSPLAATPGTAFTVSSAIYASPACSGSTALLYPGVTDCAVLTVHNNLTVPINVQDLSTTIPSPPSGCTATNFSLPKFSGNMSVPASGTAKTAGLPISLIDTRTNQDACKGVNVTFTFTGSAQFTDSTSTALTSSPNASASGQPVTLTATVTGANSANDPSTPTGTVTFNSCPTSACTTTTPLGTGTISGEVATLTTLNLTTGTHYIQAVYGGSGTDYTGSTSPVLTLTISAPVTSGATTGGNGTSGAGAATSTSTMPSIAFTGADIAGMAAVALVMIGGGAFLVIAVRRRRRTAQS